MSTRKSPIPLEKVTLNLFRGDFAMLGTLHPAIGASAALREILHAHVKSVIEEVERTTPAIAPPQLEMFPKEPPNV